MVAAIVIAAGMTTYHFWNRWPDLVVIAERTRRHYFPRWRADTAATLHNTLIEVAILGTALLLAFGYAAFAYGQRKTELVAATHAANIAKARTEADTLRRALAERDARATNTLALRQSMREAEVRHLAETAALRREIEQTQKRRATALPDRETDPASPPRSRPCIAPTIRPPSATPPRSPNCRGASARPRAAASHPWKACAGRSSKRRAAPPAEIARLERELTQAERKLVSLTTHRRLTIEEKYAIIDALRPFAGQKVTIAAIDGDEDGKVYAADFAEVFEAAGWEHPAISYRRWDRDPVGVEITLNEADGRAGRVNVAVGALINVVRKLSLTDGNTIYMNGEVPAGQVQIKIGKKLPRE